MYRSITYDPRDLHCRYLGIDLNENSPFSMCGGRFYSFAKNTLRLEKLPYRLKVWDLIYDGCLEPRLFVSLPTEYFFNWKNYPILGRKDDVRLAPDIEDAGYYQLEMIPRKTKMIEDYCHSYDGELMHRFKERFGTDIRPIEKALHPNGREFYPNECFLAYWQAYMLFEATEECRNIDKFLPYNEGAEEFKKHLTRISNQWRGQYAEIFNAVSHYITFTTFNHLSEKRLECTYGDIASHLFQASKTNVDFLMDGMSKLLELHKGWTRRLDYGLGQYKYALKSLKRDIYFLFEWLCSAGKRESDLFNKWKCNGQARPWSQLHDVIDFEEITFEDMFNRYVPIYSAEIKPFIDRFEIDKLQSYFAQFNSFKPWLRAFCDLHIFINKKETIKFVQPRTLDTTLAITIRTEVLIRQMFSTQYGEEEPNDLKELIRRIGEAPNTETKATQVLQAVADKQKWKLAELYGRPEDVFANIDNVHVGKGWSKEQKYFFKAILKFVAARNYFAHHYYRDSEFEYHSQKSPNIVITSCLHSIIYIGSVFKPCLCDK